MDETLSSGPDFNLSGAAGGDFETQLQVAQEATTMMTQMHYINEICWDTCITGNPGSSLSSRESNCLSNCVERFVDTTLLITNRSDIKKKREIAVFLILDTFYVYSVVDLVTH